MSEKKEIVAGRWKFKRIDSLSWQVFELREVGENNDPTKNRRAGETAWMALPAYFGTLLPAIVKAKELNRERELPESSELSSAVKAIKKADDKFLAEIKKAVA